MTVILTATGLIYSWGFGKSGSLGLGEISNTMTPLQISKLSTGEPCEGMVDISVGSSHTLALDNTGKTYSWGNG